MKTLRRLLTSLMLVVGLARGETERQHVTAQPHTATAQQTAASVEPGIEQPMKSANAGQAAVTSMRPEMLEGFAEQPEPIQQLVRSALALTEQGLSYRYGSSDPKAGGMDCSGFIYYLLTTNGYRDVPRDSSGQYAWVLKDSVFHSVLGRNQNLLNDMKPGDLLFWSGTYKVNRATPISHVMIYLGKEKSTGKPVMVGASDGRTYRGLRMSGVSVFDFKLPSGQPNKDDSTLTARFEGYGSIPPTRLKAGL